MTYTIAMEYLKELRDNIDYFAIPTASKEKLKEALNTGIGALKTLEDMQNKGE